MPATDDDVRASRWPAVAVFPVLGLACLGVTVSCTVAAAGRERLWSFGDDLVISNGLGTALAGLVMTALAAVVLARGGHRTMGLALGGTGLFWALDGVAEGWVALALVTDHALTGATFAAWFLLRFTSLLPASIVLLPLLFPTGRFLPGRWGAASWACMAVMTGTAVVFMLAPDGLNDYTARIPPGVDRDWGAVDALPSLSSVFVTFMQLATLVMLVVPVGVVIARFRRSTGAARDQMRWLLWGALVTVGAVLVASVVDLGPLTDAAFLVIVTLVPVAMTIAVVNPQVVAIEELLGRTVLLALVATILVAVDLAVVAGLTAALGDSLEQRQVVVVVLLLTLLLYGPLRQRLSAGVRRLMLGRADRYDAVAGLASALETSDEGSEQLAAVARSVATSFGVGFVAVEVDRGSGGQLVASHGTRPAETRVLPISYRGATVGRLVLPARGLRSRLSRRDEELLGDLVRQAATAARTSRLADELQESRERLVSAREEERRRIRRDLHDGLGPALSGVVFQLESARLMVDRDPAAARDQVHATSQLVQEVVADVRRLVHDLRPPALDDLGLVGALRQLGDRLDPPATVEADDLPALPAAVEVAAYRVVSEAMANVARHAHATTCRVRLTAGASSFDIEVVDDGAGIPADVEAGVGLIGLRERAEELGGTSEITCPPDGGTVVRVTLPLQRSTP